ncbi:hypothetical protein LCGC14_2053010 [marine sediment metagenome]|uniref:Uncharacterized protein n=1 Tax=marine sediment metagenome TaxID=412755 RepID=A0A0F9ENE0_9ZZZZ
MSAKKYFTELKILYEISKGSGDSRTGLRILMLLLEDDKEEVEDIKIPDSKFDKIL